jgi:hypothetical protein
MHLNTKETTMLAEQTKIEVDLTRVDGVLLEATVAARAAAASMHQAVGDRDACGFAWVSVYDVRSNSRLGKMLQAAGFRKAYNGGLQLWDPSKYPTQSVSVLEAGAEAYADVLVNELGLKAYSGSRLD